MSTKRFLIHKAMKRQIRCLIWSILFFFCVSCQLLQPNEKRPFVEFVYTVNGEQKKLQEHKHGGFGLGTKYWVAFMFDLEGNIMFNTDACHQGIDIISDESVFRDGKKYYNDNIGHVFFSESEEHHLEMGWFSFHIVDDGDTCFEISFDTVWSDNETGDSISITGTFYVYDKYYGKHWDRVYRKYIVPE